MRNKSISTVDKVYRAIVGNGIFPAGWGDAGRLRALMEFHEILSNRAKVQSLLDPNPPVIMDKVEIFKKYSVHSGHIFSPFAKHCPGLLPECAESCRFELVLPKQFRMGSRPVAIHMAGTGDQHFWRRRWFLAEPLATLDGVASLIIENPFYGQRRPKEQIRSNVRFVSDIFVMGGGLMLEGLSLLQWLELKGFGPFCLTGISMGGHMASLGATNYPKPIGVAPCLSWTTASTVFTRGVMSNAINWEVCDRTFNNEPAFRDEIFDKLIFFDWENTEMVGDKTETSLALKKTEEEAKVLLGARLFGKWLRAVFVLPKALSGPWKWNFPSFPSVSSYTNPGHAGASGQQEGKKTGAQPKQNFYKRGDSATRRESLEFMRRLMDHFTHLSNFERPVDPALATVISARCDAYVLRDGVKPIQEIWPGCTVRFIDTGHVVAYMKHQSDFRWAICDSLLKHREKYYVDGTPRAGQCPDQPNQCPDQPNQRPDEPKPSDGVGK